MWGTAATARRCGADRAFREIAVTTEDPTPPPAPAEPDLTWRVAAQKLKEPMDVRIDHLVAAGGAVLFLIAGAVCGAWMQVV